MTQQERSAREALRGFGRRLKNIAHDPKWSIRDLVGRMRTTADLVEKHATMESRRKPPCHAQNR